MVLGVNLYHIGQGREGGEQARPQFFPWAGQKAFLCPKAHRCQLTGSGLVLA